MQQGAYERWLFTDGSKENVQRISRESGLAKLPAEILSKRMELNSDINQWLNTRLDGLLDPADLPFCEKASTLFCDFLLDNKRVAIFSDYDVDGISSAALLSDALKQLGSKPICFLPDRMEEGYGLTDKALGRILESESFDLLFVLDCGTRSEDQLQILANKGISAIVIDHHARSDTPLLPPHCILINPHLKDRFERRFQVHCTAGLVFKFIHCVTRELHGRGIKAREIIDLRSCLDLVALGTVADLVPLVGENRTLVQHGLRQIARSKRQGLKALLQVTGVQIEHPLSASDIGYRLGPRINAGGRIETGQTSLDLLLATDYRLAFDLARKLDAVNRERQIIEKSVLEKASELLGKKPPLGIVVGSEDWHPGVVGIVAGRIARKFHRPAIVLGFDGEEFKGSGRGIDGLNLIELMENCAVQPHKWGGHPMAMGMSIKPELLPDFADAFAESVEGLTGGDLPPKTLRIDASAKPEEIDRSCFLELESLGPFGQGNPQPIVVFENMVLREPPRMMGKDHLRFKHPANSQIDYVGWRMAQNAPPAGRPVDLAVRLSRSFWKGRESLRAEIVDWRYAG